MSLLTCKMCGGKLEASANQTIVQCPYCGTKQTIPSTNEDKKLALFEKANELRLKKEFDKAEVFYDLIISEFPKEAEAYWGLILCDYGIEYVTDPKSNKKVPTCHRFLYKSILENDHYFKVMELSDVVAKDIYASEAKAIDDIQKKIIDVQPSEQYDIFICYKETDKEGNRTEDSVIAQEIYSKLHSEGYKVFFSKISLEGKMGSEFEPVIYSALISSRILIHVTTSTENTNSIWVKNEWERFIENVSTGKSVIPCYKNINPSDLPPQLKRFQGLDLTKIGAMQDLLHGVSKFFEAKKERENEEVSKIDDLKTDYDRNEKMLLQADDFCYSAKEIFPIVCFFEKNRSFRDGEKYLAEAMYQFSKHVSSTDDCDLAEVYLKSIIPYKDSEQLLEQIERKKRKFREKELIDQGYIIDFPKEDSLDSLLVLINEIIKSRQLFLESSDLSPEDKNLIDDNCTVIRNYLNDSSAKVIDNSWDVNLLEKAKKPVSKLSGLDGFSTDLCFSVKTFDARIALINRLNAENKKKKLKKRLIIIVSISVAVLAVVGIIVGVVTSDKANHSDQKIVFKMTNKTQEYKSNVSPYVNGCYYVYFDCEINCSSSVGVDYMSFITTVKKDGSDLGRIKTSLDSMNLASNSTKSYRFYLEDNQPETNNNTLFISLYNASYSSLSFSYEVLSISFSDGRFFYGANYNNIY